jgi:hypothetical protein
MAAGVRRSTRSSGNVLVTKGTALGNAGISVETVGKIVVLSSLWAIDLSR